MELAGRHLLQRRRVEDDSPRRASRSAPTARIAHVADVELQLGVGVALAHVVLLLLVAAEDADLRESVFRKRRNTALPKEPVPPVISNTPFISVSCFECDSVSFPE